MTDPTLPFFDEDPSPEEEPLRGTRGRPYAISEINAGAREILEEAFSDVWIQGEISNFKAHGSGHYYFSLKDDRAQINAVMFRSANALLRFRPADGQAILARGRLSIYEPRGSYQINVQWMEPLGLGTLQAAFERLKRRLRDEGLFDAERKRPIPMLPRGVGIVTSPTGAAIRDILRVLERRARGLRVIVAPCPVQGEGAAPRIADALRRLNDFARTSPRPEESIDVLIVARGGGSLEDLWPFNEEIVARAIASSDLPVISAVGHETDYTIADFVADVRAPTPSAAAEMVASSRDELGGRLASAEARLRQAIRILLLRGRGTVQNLARSRAFARVEAMLAQAQQRRDEAMMRLTAGMRRRLLLLRERLRIEGGRLAPRSLRAEVAARRGRLDSAAAALMRGTRGLLRSRHEQASALQALLNSLSPLAVLDRGYAICQDEATGAVITRAREAAVGQAVRMTLARGRLGARVTWTEEDAPTAGGPEGARGPRGSREGR